MDERDLKHRLDLVGLDAAWYEKALAITSASMDLVDWIESKLMLTGILKVHKIQPPAAIVKRLNKAVAKKVRFPKRASTRPTEATVSR